MNTMLFIVCSLEHFNVAIIPQPLCNLLHNGMTHACQDCMMVWNCHYSHVHLHNDQGILKWLSCNTNCVDH